MTKLVVIVVILVIVGSPVYAQSQTALDPIAQQHADAGKVAYDSGDYDGASREFEAGYRIDPKPALLYAWAQAQRLGKHCDEAITLYRKYLDSGPSETMVTHTRGFISACQAELATPPPPPPAPPVRDTPHEPSPWYRDPIGGTLLVSGTIGLGVGAGFLVVASRSKQRADAAEFRDDFEIQFDEANTRRRIGGTAIGVGAALVIGGVIAYALRRDDGSVTAIGTNGQVVQMQGRF